MASTHRHSFKSKKNIDSQLVNSQHVEKKDLTSLFFFQFSNFELKLKSFCFEVQRVSYRRISFSFCQLGIDPCRSEVSSSCFTNDLIFEILRRERKTRRREKEKRNDEEKMKFLSVVRFFCVLQTIVDENRTRADPC